MKYQKMVICLKALAEPNRLKIVNLLSCGTKCACDLLEYFNFTQPTLSHHMKVLEKSGIITVEKKSKWVYYTLNQEFTRDFQDLCQSLFSHDEETCVCGTEKNDCSCSK